MKLEVLKHRKRSRSEESEILNDNLATVKQLKKQRTVGRPSRIQYLNQSPMVLNESRAKREGKSTTGEAPMISSITSDEQVRNKNEGEQVPIELQVTPVATELIVERQRPIRTVLS